MAGRAAVLVDDEDKHIVGMTESARYEEHHVSDWNDKVIEEFRGNAGKVGGPFEGAPIVLLTTTGRRSGRARTNPLMYLPDDGRILVFASKGGAPEHPDWYTNLLTNPDVTVEVGTDRYEARATEVTGEERDRIYSKQASLFPNFAEYQEKTDRKIPVVALVPR
jgi:deazaflavin-dependent oxidoreductase (nitroreductase family)